MKSKDAPNRSGFLANNEVKPASKLEKAGTAIPFLTLVASRQHSESLQKNTCYGRGYETSHQDLADIIDSLHA